MRIFLAWIEKRAFLRDYGKAQVCNWTTQGTEEDLRDATQYARVYKYRVYSFPDSVPWEEARDLAKQLMQAQSPH